MGIFIPLISNASPATAMIMTVKSGKSLSAVESINPIIRAGMLSKVTRSSLTMSKSENIQSLIELAIKENRIGFVKHVVHSKAFSKLKGGDKLLLKCLKSTACNMDNFPSIVGKSTLHAQIITKAPHLNLTQTNIRVGVINENIMAKYFQSMGWKKIEGEVGRNGIDGLFIKRKNKKIIDILIVESKYNTSGLQYTKSGKQMSKTWVTEKIRSLQKKYPGNQDYQSIQRFIQNDSYRALLWNLKVSDKTLKILVKNIHDKEGVVTASAIQGRDKMKINFARNQEININKPANAFHNQVASWYREELK
ncbi:MAG: hypothetical protein R8M45_05940 [Ghiorsea sp.]